MGALSRQLDYLARHSLHYADVLGEAGFAPGDLGSFDDLRRLPMTGKADFVASVAEATPPLAEQGTPLLRALIRRPCCGSSTSRG